MKKIISLLAALMMLFTLCVSAEAPTVTIYAPDGREALIYLADLADYTALGWFENKEDILKTIYYPDGKELSVYLADVEDYMADGWFESREDILKTIYAPDGREALIYLADLDTYTALGWFENKDDVTKTIYAPDGREALVYIAEVDTYTALGWFDDINDVTTTMRSPDGEKITVFHSEVADYKELGWTVVQSNRIDPTKPMVALTFDDGPYPPTTGRVLTALENYNARATFFVLGDRSSTNTDILNKMTELGCQVGNHSYSHPDLITLSSRAVTSQISRTSDIIYNATGSYPTVIRPPYGSYNNSVLYASGKPFILWSIDTLDWKYRNADYVTSAALSNVRDGDIILMHDIYDSTAAAAERIIPALIAKGYQLVTVDELAYHKGITMSAYNTYNSFR